MKRLAEAPLIVSLMGLGAIAMIVPAVHALLVNDHETSRAFLYPCLLFFILFVMVALATTGMKIRRPGRSHLISIVACLAGLPLMLAVPFAEAVPDTRFFNAYVEMVSSLTTTGLTLFEPDRLPPSVHLWRALVGWMGGFFIWVIAVAILAPLNLGGFEVTSDSEIGQGAREADRQLDNAHRMRRYTVQLLPIYVGLTMVLWLALFMVGDPPLIAICHAMSTLSTSGISPLGALEGGAGGRGEAVIALFLLFALSRLTFLREDRPEGWESLWHDPELRLGLLITGAVAGLLFLRHWMVSFEEGLEVPLLDGLRALWGAIFTTLSFLTTTGFVSGDWEVARAWSGLGAPGVLLLGLAVFGGGVATTAGGVKLLRVHALYQHSMREMEKLVQPSSIGSSGRQGRRFRRQGAFAAWVFFMLFALSIAVVMMGFSLIGGLDFEEAMILTIASLSTTGPLTEVAGSAPVHLAGLSDAARSLLAAAMVVGRLEALALIAFLNPEFWR
ncbi:MAG: TrkH family potassium uptake protein [Silicimonas sp.]|nr:TrkH family potassium uptake protein [Silicimonas sp.]